MTTAGALPRFEIVGRLAAGDSPLCRAQDLANGRPALVQLLTPDREGVEALARFRRAALAASSLGHPHIARLEEVGAAGGDLCLALAPAAGEPETLESRLAHGSLARDEAVGLAAQIAAGLAEAHAAGIVHGDLQPDLVLLTPEGEARITAFGLGELADAAAHPGAAAPYRPPERLLGAPPDPRTDVWALGIILYRMLAGVLPFRGLDERERAEAMLHLRPDPLPNRASLPAGLEAVVLRALARRPDDRYPDARTMEADLRAVAAGAAVAPQSGSRPDLQPDLQPTLLEIPVSRAPEQRLVRQRSSPDRPADPALHGAPSYRLLEKIGSGGTAVVYRAEDTLLGRSVALKFLAPELSRDPESKARFLREARAASALDHPNLCTIHEVGEDEEGRVFLAMPCYEGETLRERLERGPLPVDQALAIAIQAGQGLARAHRQGIVHRDVKPANLMLTTDGVVKVLDFGLAKLDGAARITRGTAAGGTLAYMSPEQARGEEVDARSDLWSLGVVLYEMVTGSKPFSGDTLQAVLAAIQRAEPEPVSRLRPEAPTELDRILARLLAKDPAGRYPDGESAVAALRALRGPETVSGRRLQAPVPRRRRLWRTAMQAGAVAAFVTAAGLLLWSFGPRKQGGPVLAATFTPLTHGEGRETFPSLAPGGEFFVYVAPDGGDLDIFWQRMGGDNPLNLTEGSPWDDTQPAVSPDGQQIAFRSEREGGGLFLMGATGESVRRLADACFNPAWSPNGQEIACATEGIAHPRGRLARSRIWRIEVATGTRRLVDTEDGVQPSWSPRGRRIAFWGLSGDSARRALWTVAVDDAEEAEARGEPVLVLDDGALNWSPVWSPDGVWLYFASDRGGSMNLWRVAIDEESGRVRGEPEAVMAPNTASVLPSLTRDGRRIAFAGESERSQLVRVAFDPQSRQAAGPLQPVSQWTRAVRSGDVSPDGRWIVFDISAPQEDLFLVRVDGGGLRQLTDDAWRDRMPRWSPDGQRILFYSDRGGKYEAWALHVDGGEAEQLTRIPGRQLFDPIWSPDGRRLICALEFRGPYVIDLAEAGSAASEPRPLLPLDEADDFAVSSWSADGRRLAGFDRASRIVLFSFATGRREVLPETGEEVAWLPDGRSLAFLRDGEVWMLEVATRRTTRVLAPPRGSAFKRLGVAPDGRSLYLVQVSEQGDIGLLTLP